MKELMELKNQHGTGLACICTAFYVVCSLYLLWLSPTLCFLCSWSLPSSFLSFAALMCKTQHSTKAHMDKHTNSQASQDADRQMPAKATDKQR